jgi:hypothetical protein
LSPTHTRSASQQHRGEHCLYLPVVHGSDVVSVTGTHGIFYFASYSITLDMPQMGPVKRNFVARDSLAGHQFDTARVNVKRRCIVGRPDEDLQVPLVCCR